MRLVCEFNIARSLKYLSIEEGCSTLLGENVAVGPLIFQAIYYSGDMKIFYFSTAGEEYFPAGV